MTITDYRKQIDDFESHYRYDSTYMREMLDTSPQGYAHFWAAMPLAGHRELLERDDYWIARIAAMRAEDCGECLQLNVRMALEAGLPKDLAAAAVAGGNELPAELKDLNEFAYGVATGDLADEALVSRIESRLNKGQLLELGVCVSTAKLFPTIKRAVGYTKSCSLVQIEI